MPRAVDGVRSVGLPLWLDGVLVASALFMGAAVTWWIYGGGNIADLMRKAEAGYWVRGRVAVARHEDFYELRCSDWRWHQKVKVTNPWNVTLEVTDVRSSCNCTRPELQERTIPPGGETWMELEATIIPNGKPTQVQVDLRCRSGHRLVHIFSVRRYRAAVVESADALSPGEEVQRISFGPLWPGQQAQGRWRVSVYYDGSHGEGKPVRLAVETTSEKVAAAIGELRPKEPLHGGAVGRMETELQVNLTAGEMPEVAGSDLRLLVQYADGSQRWLPLNVAWSVRSVWLWEPASVFVELESGERDVRDVVCRLQHAEGRPFNVLGVEAEVPWLEVVADGRQLRASPALAQEDGSGTSPEAAHQAVDGGRGSRDAEGGRRDTAGATSAEASFSKEIRLRVRGDLAEDWAATELGLVTDAPRQQVARLRVSVKRCGMDVGHTANR